MDNNAIIDSRGGPNFNRFGLRVPLHWRAQYETEDAARAEFVEALGALCDLDERLTISGNPADVEDWQTAIATVKDWLASDA